MSTTGRRALRWTLLVCAACAFLVALFDIAGGSFSFRILGVRVSSWDSYKPFRVGMLAMVSALWLHDHGASPTVSTWHRIDRIAPIVTAAITIAFLCVAIRFGIFAAGGADAYGYVSQAYLWTSGSLHAPNPLASVTAAIGPAVAPLGYQLADDPRWLVPIYPPGLPMLMAVALRVAGPWSVYYVVPLFGALVIVMTYALGCRVADRRAGMAAAVLVAFSPAFFFQSLEPMGDVPVTAAWLGAWLLAMSPQPWSSLASG